MSVGIDERQPEAGDSSAPKTFPALPERTRDGSATFDECLTAVLRLLRTAAPEVPDERELSRFLWQQSARDAVAGGVRAAGPDPALLDALVRAAVHDPSPSFNRRLVAPAVEVFGARPVMKLLIALVRSPDEYLRHRVENQV